MDYSENGGSSYTTYYYLRNAQGDIVKLIDNNKNTVVEYTYDSWGKVLAVTGSLATSLGEDQPFRYRGYVYDTETQLYYLQSRYYDHSTCRFISSDVYLSTGQGVIGHNSYAYCLNNPVNMFDGEGTIPQWVITGVIHLAITASPGGWIRYYAAKGIITAASNAFLAHKGYHLARAMFNHAMWGYGAKAPASINNLIIERMRNSAKLKSELEKRLKNACGNKVSFLLNDFEFKGNGADADLFYAIQHVDIYVIAKKVNGKWKVYLSASDIYNFDELRIVLYGITFANAANDLGWAMQRIGMLVIYSFSVSFFWGDI